MRTLLATVTIAAAIIAPAATAHHAQPTKTAAAWQYRWQKWLPDNWRRLGACETGYGVQPGNWHHANRQFVSAFGIQRGAFRGGYDHDARMAGMPPWNDTHPPTPWQQYRTALTHYRLYGDGWGCPGP